MKTYHVWERVEIVLAAQGTYDNPYTDVEVWANLIGPGFSKRVYGFWDGGSVFRIRLLATKVGTWNWSIESNVSDSGMDGTSGSFEAVAWSDHEKEANPTRRGFICASADGHGFELADGSPFFLLGDTWWAVPTFRYRWYDDDVRRPVGPEMGYKDMVRYRKAQGYNSIAILAGFPTWAADGRPSTIVIDDDSATAVRAAWAKPGTSTAKDMHNEGGRPFCFPGTVPEYEDVVPDFDRINPDYFRFLDRKIDFLNDEGFFPFMEVARRDVSQVWQRYGRWPESYARYIQYVFCRYQANNCLLSPIHFDYDGYSIPSRAYNEPANLLLDTWGAPPFGTLLGTNSAPSSLVNFGGPDEARWLTFHQLGNWREHDNYWYLTQIHNADHPLPGVNGEPYYPGFPGDNPPAASEDAELNCRSGLYGGFLSGGFAGYLYGAEGLWGGDIDPAAKYTMWDALGFRSGDQIRHLVTFADAAGLDSYGKLVPDDALITPNRSGAPLGYRGWAFCARTSDRTTMLCYFEKECPQATIRGVVPEGAYELTWFDPVGGTWSEEPLSLQADRVGRLTVPAYPSRLDNALRLRYRHIEKLQY
jgi:hypothetical protein